MTTNKKKFSDAWKIIDGRDAASIADRFPNGSALQVFQQGEMMGTISKEIADDVIAGKYDDDRPVKIVKYEDAWGGEAYGLICEGQPLNRYDESEYVRNPSVYWEIK